METVVYKFGGASIKNAASIKNIGKILFQEGKGKKIIIVISALGKTTNALEVLLDAAYYRTPNLENIVDKLEQDHLLIINDLMPDNLEFCTEFRQLYQKLREILPSVNTFSYDFSYDQVVSFGEKFSSFIVSYYFNTLGLNNVLVDATKIVATDDTHREGKVDWWLTELNMKAQLGPALQNNTLFITQGFIAGAKDGSTVTLGREGSDYSAAIFAYCLDIKVVTIWKDVPGVLNADPRYFNNTQLLESLNYFDATELAYYGASVIHPKTIKPLQNKEILLYVRSFLDLSKKGTLISAYGDKTKIIPTYIVKQNQILLSIYPKDFSFIAEENIFCIFEIFIKYGVKINLMQNSAMTFSVCADANVVRWKEVFEDLQKDYKVVYNENLELITVRHYTQEILDYFWGQRKEFLMEQKNRNTAQIVVFPLVRDENMSSVLAV